MVPPPLTLPPPPPLAANAAVLPSTRQMATTVTSKASARRRARRNIEGIHASQVEGSYAPLSLPVGCSLLTGRRWRLRSLRRPLSCVRRRRWRLPRRLFDWLH